MGKCRILNETNEKESELYNELFKILGTDTLAEEAYSKAMGAEFREDFGDWVANYKSGLTLNPQMAERLNEDGEPKLFKKSGTNQYYFQGTTERIFLNKEKFPEMTHEEVDEVVNELLYDYVTQGGKNKSYNELFAEDQLRPSDLLPSIEKSMEEYLRAVEGYDELTERANLVLKYKKDFETEIFNKIESLGFAVKSKLVDATGENENEISENDKSSALNIKESFESNSKDSATVNTKLFLSQIADIRNIDGNFVEVHGDFLAKKSFTSFEEVWSTLEPRLSDVVGFGHGQAVSDVFDLMVLEIQKLEYVKPWTIDLINKLELLNEDKKTEFVQAFSKTKLNFYVTEYNKGVYKVINATSTNSRESKILNEWGVNFLDNFNFVKGSLTDVSRTNIQRISNEINTKLSKFQSNLKASNKDNEMDVLQEGAEDLIETLNQVGVSANEEDLNAFILSHGGEEFAFREVLRLFKDSKRVLEYMLNPDTEFKIDGEFVNPFLTESGMKDLARAIGLGQTEISENTVLMNKGKMGWTYASPSYLSNKVNEWKEDRAALEKLAMLPYNKNSKWIKYLLGTDQRRSSKDALELSRKRLSNLQLGLTSSFKSAGKNDGTDNKETTFPDAVNDSIVKMLGGKSKAGKSYFPTIVPADKSRRIEIDGMEYFDSRIDRKDSGEIYIHPDTVKVFVDYFEDEYTRMKIVSNEIDTLPDSKKIVHYHTKAQNGLKSQLFPELSFENENMDEMVRSVLYDTNGRPLSSELGGLDNTQRQVLSEVIRKTLVDRVQETENAHNKLDNISKNTIAMYSGNINPKTALAGDYLVNGLIANIEYMKMFSGDPAYYKNTGDLIKRIPATYTDGLQLRLKKADHLFFNQATISGVEVASKYVDLIKKSVKDKNIAKDYERVNTTDAQAWITPNRWKFLKQRLGQWSPLHDSAYKKMISGKRMSKAENKVAAQPLKGVYFEINEGRPVYLKYSQAVLLPELVKGTPMEAVYNKMTLDSEGKELDGKNEIHEVITIDGVKVGALNPQQIHKDGTTEISDSFELTPTKLSNRGWKLQQDLPVKLMHDTNVGSQVQKNILSGMVLDGEYDYAGEKITGRELMSRIHNTVSALSNLGKARLEERFSIVDGKITDSDSIYRALIDEFKSRGGNDNIISALEKEMPFDAIPQIKDKVQSIFMSIMNKEITKISTNGGSYIQVSPFGLESVGVSESTENIYDKLGSKTKSKNVQINSIYQKAGVEYANSIDGVFSLRVNNSQNHFGNPFSSVESEIKKGLIKTNSTKESVIKYADWVINSEDERAKWIRSEIKSGKLKGKPIVYYKELGQPSHATILDYLINDYNWNYDSGIKIVSNNYDGKGLQPPRIEDGIVKPGQVFIPHSEAARLLWENGEQDINSMTGTEIMEKLDPSALEMIAYRIPNQGMSSNDALEIVGILPPGMGDSIIAYDGIPAKTGSDFDIDKMFVMTHNLEYDKETEKITKVKDGQKGLENELVDLYKSVLTSPHTYDAMMTSIDGGFLKDDIVDLFPDSTMGNLELFSPIKQIETKFQYLSGKFGVAQTANQLVDHVLNQTQDIRYNGYLGVGHQDTNEDTKFDNIKDVNGEHNIADTISAFLNAYVDIAKDPYISRGNHNAVTANVAFMLVRAGTPITWVNRFIGQPILKELVEITKTSEGKTSNRLEINGVKANAYEILRKKYGIKDIKEKEVHPDSKLHNEDKMKEMIGVPVESMTQEQLLLQEEVLSLFENFQDKAKFFAASVSASKADTNGGGGSFMDRFINSNKFNDVVGSNRILGFEEKFQDTMLGTYHSNSIDWVGEVVNNSNIFLSASNDLNETFNHISNRLGKGGVLLNSELAKKLDASYYSYAMSNSSLFELNNEEIRNLFSNTVNEIKELKKTSGNFMIQELDIKFTGGASFLSIDSKNKPTLYNNKIYRAWLELYKDPATKNLAVDLVQYSYYQSGFQNNLDQFFTHIPHEIMIAEGIKWDIRDMFNNLKDLSMDDNFRDQFMRHNYADSNIVPEVAMRNVKAIAGTDLSSGFSYIPTSDGNSISTGVTAAGLKTWPEFVMMKSLPDRNDPNSKGVEMLYKYIGSIKNAKGKYSPQYVRTHKLGFKSNSGSILEYSFDNNKNESVTRSNNLSEYLLGNVKKITNFVESHESFLPADITMDPNMYVSKDVHDDSDLVDENIETIVKDNNIRCK